MRAAVPLGLISFIIPLSCAPIDFDPHPPLPPAPAAATKTPAPSSIAPLATSYPLHRSITATVFWIGEPPTKASPTNASSAWDERWQQHFGGYDDPTRGRGHLPLAFVPRENPFYVALPFNDFKAGHRRADLDRIIPWARGASPPKRESLCKNRWVRIDHAGRTCYAQWEDVGPFVSDDAAYVFGNSPPRNPSNQNAGIDVSPAVRDHLSLNGIGQVDWRFIEASQVPPGPWTQTITRTGVDWR